MGVCEKGVLSGNAKGPLFGPLEQVERVAPVEKGRNHSNHFFFKSTMLLLQIQCGRVVFPKQQKHLYLRRCHYLIGVISCALLQLTFRGRHKEMKELRPSAQKSRPKATNWRQ